MDWSLVSMPSVLFHSVVATPAQGHRRWRELKVDPWGSIVVRLRVPGHGIRHGYLLGGTLHGPLCARKPLVDRGLFG